METVDLTQILEAVVTLIAALVSAFLIPYLKQKIGDAKLAEIQEWVLIAVRAAEQIFNESGMGAQKKQYVLDFLESKGFSVDLDELDRMIEAAVLELNREAAGKEPDAE